MRQPTNIISLQQERHFQWETFGDDSLFNSPPSFEHSSDFDSRWAAEPGEESLTFRSVFRVFARKTRHATRGGVLVD